MAFLFIYFKITRTFSGFLHDNQLENFFLPDRKSRLSFFRSFWQLDRRKMKTQKHYNNSVIYYMSTKLGNLGVNMNNELKEKLTVFV